MNRKVVLLAWSIVITSLVLLGRSAATSAAPSATAICGPIGNSTWTPAGNPYQVCVGGATVGAGVTLNIQPGVVVEFAAGGKLTSRGTLSALGTITQPITFTGAVATPGSWLGLVVESLVVTPSVATLDHVIFEYGGLANYYGSQLYADAAVVTVTNGLFRNGAGSGLVGTDSVRLSVHDTEFSGNGNDAMRLVTPIGGTDLGGLTASLNGRNVVFVDSTTYMPGDQVWPAAGIPYLVNAVFGNAQGNSLSLAPGVEMRFTTTGYLNIRGDFEAIGLPTAPITLTGSSAVPGHWTGLVLYGLTRPATAQLDYVTIEYGGKGISSGANINVDSGHLVARNSIVRFSLYDGVRFGTGGTGSIMNSQVLSNNQYGVRNVLVNRFVLASNNWWGHPSGPTPDTPACGNGQGDGVTDGVLFQPVLTSTVPVDFPLTDSPSLSLSPRRWFAPADGQTKVFFDIVLLDGDGHPLPGRAVNVSTTHGTATSGGITDSNGRTLAYLVANSPGTAEITAVVANSGCEGALSPTASVTFEPPLNIVNLFPDARAPYFDGAMSVSPMPVLLGVPTKLTTKLTNPLTVPITVDLTFGYVQSSIGLAFGPISQLVGQVIPAQSTREFSATFVPPVSGHFCVDVAYSITGIGTAEGLMLPAGPGGGRQQRNLNTYPGPTSPPSDKDALKKADEAWNLVNKLPVRGVPIQKAITNSWWDKVKKAAEDISKALGGDPPRQDYQQITLPNFVTWPAVQPGGGISQARADALNAASDDLANVVAYGRAAALALDRYAGASEAYDQTWAATQANARLEYEQQMGAALLAYADHLDAFRQVLIDENEIAVTLTVSDVISYQQALQTSGFTAQEIADAHLAGLTDAEIEAHKQEIIAADPNDLAGSILDKYEQEAEAARALGVALLTSNTYSPGFGVSGSAGLQPSAVVSNTMIQIDNAVSTFVVGNPLTQTATIQLRPRRIDLPADWTVAISPGEVTLAPGAQATVTVTILTGSPIAQGATPRVAVEGYAGSQLLGGVVIDIVAPAYTERFDTHNLFLPVLLR
jgi:hypothetical protein